MTRHPRMIYVAIATLCAACASAFPSSSDGESWYNKATAHHHRDDWGIAHAQRRDDAGCSA